MVGIKYQSGTVGHFTDLSPIGSIPDYHGLYLFPLHCITPDQTKRSLNYCKVCEAPPPPPPPPPPPGLAEIISIAVCFAIITGSDWEPQGCWTSDTYVNYDGPPPINTTITNGPSTPPHIYEGQILTIETSGATSINGVIQSQYDSGQVETGSIYGPDPNNPTGPHVFNFDATQAAANQIVNDQIAAANKALGVP